ncbi:MAG: M56 family metallopeptidase [Chitinophagaceae bacterium]|nr:M56 family metallopeptidase [Chitinophagaceae bacterium]
MLQLLESGFLLSLGKAIAASIWQMGLLFLMYHIIIASLRIKQSAAKNLLSSIFALGGFVWFTITFLFYTSQKAGRSIVIEEGSNTNGLLQNLTGSTNWQLLVNWTEYKLNLLLPYLSVAYLFVLLWFSARLLFQMHAANQLKNKGVVAVNDELKAFTDYLASSLGITKNVLLFISNKIDIPATIGFLKPVILLPATAVTHLTPAQLEAVLLHELAHIRRNDYFWNILLSVAETLLFFNPFALLLINIARKERENSCDDVVMSYQQNAAVYAEALLNVEKARLQTPTLAMALGDNKHHLMHRVKRILNLPAEKNKISTRLLALLFFTVVFALMGWVLQTKKQQQRKEAKAALTASNLPLKEEVLYFSPDALVKKENKAVTVRDAAKKISLNIRENSKENVFIVRNDEGEEFLFDKLVFEDMPRDWVLGMIPGERINMRKQQQEAEEQYKEYQGFFIRDSLLHEKQVKQYKALEEMHKRDFDKKTVRIKTPQVPMNFYFNNQGLGEIDSFMYQFKGQIPSYHFELNTEAPFVMMREREQEHEKEWSDKVKQARKKTQQNFSYNLRRRMPTADIRKMKLVDSLLEKTLQLRSFPQEWVAVMEPVKEELRKEHPQLTIIIENNHIIINGKPIQVDTSSANPPSSPRRQLKVVELMRQ